MGKKGGSAPQAPDPKTTAAAQTSTNISTAQANAIMGNVNQVTPDGTLTFTAGKPQFIEDSTAGTSYWRGPNGEYQTTAPGMVSTTGAATTTKVPVYRTTSSGQKVIQSYREVTTPGKTTQAMPEGWSQVKGYMVTPQTATQTLSPAQQAIKDQNDGAELNLGTLANQQSAFLKDYMSKPLDLSNEAVEAHLMDLQRKRLDPILASRREAEETRLANQGIRLGSSAYDTAQSQMAQNENDQWTSLALNGRQQAIQELLTARNQPIQEISALLSGSQVTMPQFVNANTPQIPTTDYAEITQQNYANQMAQWQQKQANQQNLLGGLFGLGSAAIMASDRRLKTDLKRLGTGARGIPVYAYRYLGTGRRWVGMMAQDVAKVFPEAVLKLASGMLMVDYGKVVGAR